MSNTLTNDAHQRSLRDFLTLYNSITEYCFNKCVSKFNERLPSGNETICVDVCTDNYVQFNQRFMFNFMQHQEQRKRDLERAAKENEQKQQEELIMQQSATQEQLQKAADVITTTMQQSATQEQLQKAADVITTTMQQSATQEQLQKAADVITTTMQQSATQGQLQKAADIITATNSVLPSTPSS